MNCCNKKPTQPSAVFTATDDDENRKTSFFEKPVTAAVNTAATTSDAGSSTIAGFQYANEKNE